MPESRPRDRDRAGDVAVGDQADAGAGLAALADDVLVAGPVEDDRGDVAGPSRPCALATASRFALTGASRSIDVGGLGADRDLVHVDARARVEHRAALGASRSPRSRRCARAR